MVALTHDFYVFASRVTTSFSAIFFSIWYIAQTRYVRALLGLLIRHFGSVLPGHFSDPYGTVILDVAPFDSTNLSKFDGTHPM